MWKTTDRYVQQKRVKAVESEHKLKQVYVPDYAKLGELTVGSDRAGSGRNVQGRVVVCTEISVPSTLVSRFYCLLMIIFILSNLFISSGDGAIPGNQVQGAMCLCCRATQANSW
jgi:hypothetical protein